MQAVINSAEAFGADFRMHFAGGRDYMMRSEKRTGSRPPSAGGSGKKPPRKRRKRAGFFYKLFTLILLLVLWPVGLMLLWRKKLRWGAGVKLLTGAVTLVACIVLIGFMLTVDTGNARYSAFQNSVNDFLDEAADTLVIAWNEAENRSAVAVGGIRNLSEAIWLNVREDLADGIDAGVAAGTNVRETFAALLASDESEPEASVEPSATPENSAEPTAEIEATPETTLPPIAEISIGADDDALPIYIPETAPSDGETLRAGILTREGKIEISEAPEPTEEAPVFIVKPAAEAIVYYNDGGKCYHMTSSCGSMLTAAEHTLGDTLSSSVHRCSACKTPDKSILDEKYIVWTDENNKAHLSDECAKFSGKWNIISADEAIAQGLAACYECDADQYLAALALKKEIVIEVPAKPDEASVIADADEAELASDASSDERKETDDSESAVQTLSATDAAATLEPTATPTVEPTDTPEPAATPTVEPTDTPEPAATSTVEPTDTPEATPSATLKPAALATVYHTANGKWYHAIENCSGMLGASAYTLEESYSHFKTCNTCKAPSGDLIDIECLWMDENGLCHVSDECTRFEGGYTLISLEDARKQALTGCAECFADEYLPNAGGIVATKNGDVVYYENITVVEVAP